MFSSSFCISQAAALAFYILSALFINNFVIIFMMTVLLAALDFWVVKNLSGRILVGLRWWNEINDLGESVWKFESLDQQSLARMNKKDSWLFWWTLYLTAVAWTMLAIFSLIRLQADYLLVVGYISEEKYIRLFIVCKTERGEAALAQFCNQLDDSAGEYEASCIEYEEPHAKFCILQCYCLTLEV
ncbi:Protein ECHIDNA [Glycine soja]|nr:Protein ECHIDNA [Glycine soja]